VLVSEAIQDPIALDHFARVSDSQRKIWLSGVDPEFLELTVKWFEENAVLSRKNPKSNKVPVRLA
jgi:hypothetical protein